MYLFYLFITFLFGSVIGSFLNVVILRGEKAESLSGRSHCPSCKHQLSTTDLIPIFSYIFLGGKCRYCKAKLSLQYPLVEVTTAISFSILYLTNLQNDLFNLFFFFFLTSIFIVLSVEDFKTGLLPDRYIFTGIVGTCFYLAVNLVRFSNFNTFFVYPLLSALALGGFFLLLIIVTSGKGMGGGDLKLSILIGLALGWPLSLIGVFLGFLTASGVSVMLLLSRQKTLKDALAFGPFLALGSYLAIVFGETIWTAYLKTLGF